MTLVDLSGKAVGYDWNPDPPDPKYDGKCIQMIHFKGKYSPFAIQNFTGGDVYSGERTWYSVFPSWNHWPTAQVNSSGRNAEFPDRASHCSISHFFWPLYRKQEGNIPFEEKLLMEGMTDQPAASLTGLAKSRLNAPPVIAVTGGTYQGYDQSHRAYQFSFGTAPLTFKIDASTESPIHNLCFEIRNWNSRNARTNLQINGMTQSNGPSFRQGVNIDTDGTFTLIVWVSLSATSPQEFKL